MSEISYTPPPGAQKINRNIFKTAASTVGKHIGERFGFVGKAKEAIKNVGKDDKFEVIDGTKVTYEEFKPAGKEVVDPTKAVIYLAGFPWSAAEKSIHTFPQALTNSFGTRGFIVDSKRNSDDSQSLRLQAESVRKFFEQKGVSEFTLVGQSLGTIKAAYLAENLEGMGKKVNSVVLANPRGMDKMGKLDLLVKFAKNVMTVEAKELEKNKQNKINVVTQGADPKEIQQGFVRSILRNIKHFGWQYIPLLKSQLKLLTEIDPIYNKIKAPVLLFVATNDLVSETEKYIPNQKVTPEQANTPAEQPIENRAAMAQTTKGRERYLKENIFTSSSNVKVLETSRIGSHFAITEPRAKQSARISAGYLGRVAKTIPKAA